MYPLKFTTNTEGLNPIARFNINRAMFQSIDYRFLRYQAFINGFFPA